MPKTYPSVRTMIGAVPMSLAGAGGFVHGEEIRVGIGADEVQEAAGKGVRGLFGRQEGAKNVKGLRRPSAAATARPGATGRNADRRFRRCHIRRIAVRGIRPTLLGARQRRRWILDRAGRSQ